MRVLQQVPQATLWADRFIREAGLSPSGFRRHAAPRTIRCAVRGIAEACIPDPDKLLRVLLTDAIRDTAAWCEEEAGSGSTSPGDRGLSPSSHSRVGGHARSRPRADDRPSQPPAPITLTVAAGSTRTAKDSRADLPAMIGRSTSPAVHR